MTVDRILLLVRHAKSSWKDESLADIDRPLNKRGQRDAPEMAARLKQRGLMPDLIVSSPAVRALATARIMAGELGYGNDIVVDEELYPASPSGVLETVKAIDDSVRIVIIVSHNPTLTELANYFSSEEIGNVPTCGIVMLSIADWKRPQEALFLDMDYPKRPTSA